MIIFTKEREDKIIDSESCVNVREWRACVNMGDRLLSMFVWMCDKIIDSESCVNVRDWCACVNMDIHAHSHNSHCRQSCLHSLLCMKSLFLVCSFCPLYTSEEKGKKTGHGNMSLRLKQHFSGIKMCCVTFQLKKKTRFIKTLGHFLASKTVIEHGNNYWFKG